VHAYDAVHLRIGNNMNPQNCHSPMI
jgi:hypothetical protein